jgi:hypothetical protein
MADWILWQCSLHPVPEVERSLSSHSRFQVANCRDLGHQNGEPEIAGEARTKP